MTFIWSVLRYYNIIGVYKKKKRLYSKSSNDWVMRWNFKEVLFIYLLANVYKYLLLTSVKSVSLINSTDRFLSLHFYSRFDTPAILIQSNSFRRQSISNIQYTVIFIPIELRNNIDNTRKKSLCRTIWLLSADACQENACG